MGDKTGIEWTDATWNPIRGCSRVSEGCRNCYAEIVASRFSGEGMPYEGLIAKGGQWNGNVHLVESALDQPMRWRKPRRIFVNSMSDLFHENVPDDVIAQVFAVMARSKNHTFQLLTKRPQRMRDWLSRVANWGGWWTHDGTAPAASYGGTGIIVGHAQWPLPNVWVGVSIEDQATADERIPLLLKTPAAVRWISAEPLLGSVDIRPWLRACYDASMRWLKGDDSRCSPADMPFLDWVVVGGESGAGARPMHPDWARSLRDHCVEAGVPFLFKQWGEWSPSVAGMWHYPLTGMPDFPARASGKDTHDFGDGYGAVRIGKKVAGRLLDGVTWDQYPAERK